MDGVTVSLGVSVSLGVKVIVAVSDGVAVAVLVAGIVSVGVSVGGAVLVAVGGVVAVGLLDGVSVIEGVTTAVGVAVVIVFCNAAVANPAFKIPVPHNDVEQLLTGNAVIFVRKIARISATVAAGFIANSRAATPATCGAAILVPW